MKTDINKRMFFSLTVIISIIITSASIISAIVLYNYVQSLESKLSAAESQLTASLSKQSETQTDRATIEDALATAKLDYSPDLEYQSLFPDLYTKGIPQQNWTDNTIYLTFDDGPTQVTGQILDILKEKDIKATFFIIGRNLESDQAKAMLLRIVNEGHSIGIHTYSHKYSEIYKSVESYLEDFQRTYAQINEITGIKSDIFRFPGGSVNGYDIAIYQELIAEMSRRGFVYFDWNVSAQDSQGQKTVSQIYNNIVPHAKNKSRSIVLMHDSFDNSTTAQALDSIIESLQKNGFLFEPLSSDVKPVIFAYPDKPFRT